MLGNLSEKILCLPSNAAATLLLRICVASNALAVAAAEGGLWVLMIDVTSFKGAEMNLF